MRTISWRLDLRPRQYLCGLLAVVGLLAQSGELISQSTLIAAWAFNEGTGSAADDRSANNHTATLTGPAWTIGKYGSGLSFDGVDDIATVADANTLDFSSALTIEAWVRPDPSSDSRPLVRKAATTGFAYSLSLTTDSKTRAEVTIGGTTYGVTGATTLTDSTWAHLAATYSGSQLKVWVNGVLDGTASVTGSISATTEALSIGGDSVADQRFPGRLDEVRLYDIALTEAQINADMGASIDDLTPPTITNAVPSSGTINVHPSSVVTITFSESLDDTTVSGSTVELRDPSNALVSGVVSYTEATHTVTFTPAAALAQLSSYTVFVRGGGTAPVVKDVAGNALAATASWSFTTGDVTPPLVSSKTPLADARNASLTTTIQATFSEPINSSTITGTTFVVTDTRGIAIAGTLSYDAPTQTATFTPSAPLLPTRPYTVTLAGGASGPRIEDLAGNAMSANHTWSFVSTVERTRIAAGNYHSAAVDDSGQVWTWGSDSLGERGTDLDGRLPGAVTAATSVMAVAAGEIHNLALKSDGTLLAWGYNAEGQLGDNSQTSRTTPVAVSTLTNVIAVAGGRLHSLALKSDGTVWVWGAGGQIGDGTSVRKLVPTQVTSLTDVIAIAAGGDHSLALKGDGTVWAWGTNTYGQIGDGSTTTRLSPVQVTGVSNVVGITGGDRHSIAILSDLTAKAWGGNSVGQIGDGTTTQRTSPVTVSSLSNVRSVEAATQRSFASLLDGATRIWGYTGSANALSATTVAGDPPSWQMSGGYSHTLLVTANGVVWGVPHGVPSNGQLGDGTTTQPASSIAISDPAYAWKVATPSFNVAAGTYTVEKVVTVTVLTTGATIHYTVTGADPTESDPVIASGATVTIDQTRTLKARAWKTGFPTSNVASATYTLQVATPLFSPTPTTYTTPQNVSMTTTSPGATIRYTTDGSTPTEASAAYTGPISVGTYTPFRAIGFRANWDPSPMNIGTYSMNFGTLAAPSFDVGTGTYTSQAVVTMTAMSGTAIRYSTDGSTPIASSTLYTGPVTVSTSLTLKARAFHVDWTMSPVTSHTYAIVVATPTFSPTAGTYPAGQLITVATATSGATLRYTLNGAEPTANDPIVTSGGTIQAGNYTVKVKGFKTGVTTSATATATYAISGQSIAPRVAGGENHSLAIRGDGTVFAWGNNANGQLGVAAGSPRLLPIVVNGLTGATRVTAGLNTSLAVASGQQPWAWGNNGYGQLGDGSTTARVPPVQPSGLTNVVEISTGNNHTLAVKSDGTVAGWGLNSQGQVGDGTTTQRLSPVAVSGLTNITGVSAGQSFSLAVASDGTAYSWGTNGNGQLGTGNTTNRSTPGTVSSLSTVTAVAAGMSHSLARLSDGTVRAWGYNGNGQLGDGTTTQRLSPVSVSSLTAIVAVAAGATHSLALDDSGVVWAWGYNFNGQLGDGTTTQRTSPVTVSGLPAIAAIAAGQYYSLAVAVDGSVWAWGRNDQGQLGDGTQTQRISPVEIADAGMAWKVAAPAFSVAGGLYTAAFNVTVTEADTDAVVHYTTTGIDPTESDPVVASGGTVAIGQTLTLKARAFKPGAVTSEITSTTYTMKVVAPTLSPTSGAYGASQSVTMSTTTPGASITYTLDSTEPSSSSTPYSGAITVADTRTVKARAFKTGWTASDSGLASYWIAAGTVATPTISPATGTYSALTLATITTSTTGATIRYTLDSSDPTASSPLYVHPLVLTATVTVKARAFLVGYGASAVATATFTVDPAGQSGRPTLTPRGGWFETQQQATVSGAAGATVRYTFTGVDPTTSDAEVPGGGLTIDRSRLVKVRAWESGLAPSSVARADFAITGAVASGQYHSLALTGDGRVFTWGWNGFGQLGDGTQTETGTPAQVITNVAAIAAGRSFSMALKRDGTVWTWGYNVTGQLGHGDTTMRFSPTQVTALTNVVAIAAGVNHAVAMKSDGTIWAWGKNADGQLGDGTTTQRTAPVQVVGLKNARSIAAGEDFTVAVGADGSEAGWVWAWGLNANGQLADGTTLSRLIPSRMPELSGVAQVAAGNGFAIARMADGTMRSWGDNTDGRLGIGVTTPAPGIHTVQPLANIRTISVSGWHVLATDIDGRLWVWGTNGYHLGAAPTATGMATPQHVAHMPTALAAAGGWMHTLVLRADGSVWAMGSGTAATVVSPPTTGLHVAGFSVGDQSALVADQDGDGLPTWRELMRGTDPLDADTNDNGLTDDIEANGSDAGANADQDGDGLSSAAELLNGTDPFLADTDSDGYNDKVDAFPLDPTRHDPLTPTQGDTTPPVITLIEPTNAVPIP
jgi:alpha-tubulin suppressor-like RCC1 family protein